MAGYNIKCMLVCQSYSNIYEHYGLKNSIFDNCHIRATMAPNDPDTAKSISLSLGQTTVKSHHMNFTGKRLAPFLANISVADQETARNLLNPDEVQKLPKDKIILMVANNHPIIANKIVYYNEEPFKSRWLEAAELSKEQHIDLPPQATNEWDKPIVNKCKCQDNIIFENDYLQLSLIKKENAVNNILTDVIADVNTDKEATLTPTNSNSQTRHVALGVER